MIAISTERNARALSLAEINAEMQKSPEFKTRIESINVSNDAARNASASRQESPFQDGLFLKLHSTVFEESIGVKFFERRDKTIAPAYSILVDIYSDKDGKNLIKAGESLYGTMLRKTEEQRLDVTTKTVVPFAEGSLNVDPKVVTANTLEELFEAFKSYTGGMMRIISTAYTGLNRRGEQGRLHVVSLVKA